MRTTPYSVANQPVTVRYVETPDDCRAFLEWVAEGHPVLALDTEATGLGVYQADYAVRLVQFGTRDVAWVLDARKFRPTICQALWWQPRFVLHNAPSDVQALARTGFISMDELLPKVVDTRILAHLHDPRGPEEGGVGLRLKQLCAVFVDAGAPDTQDGLNAVFRTEYGATKSTGWAVIDIDHPTYVLYAGLDVILTARLYEVLGRIIHERGVMQRQLVLFEHRVMSVVCQMMARGVRLDVPYTEHLAADLGDRFAAACVAAAGLGVGNVNSPRQVVSALQTHGWVPTEWTPGGQPKVDKTVLGLLSDAGNPLTQAIQEAKRANKWCESYALAMLDGRDADDRVHPSINALRARTGRMSISSPPLQQLPASDWTIRRCLVADEGQVIGGVDYQAVELRVLAALADVKRMKDAILAGQDLHDFTASLVVGPHYTPAHRKLYKTVGFGKVYGGGAATLARQSGAPLVAVQSAVAAYDRLYPEVKQYGRWLRARAAVDRGVVITPAGRHLPLDRDRLYAATNYAVQSTAADLLKQALLNLDRAGLGGYLLLPVHDEVVFQAPVAQAAEVAQEIARVMGVSDFFGVPITADAAVYGSSWGHGYGCKVDRGVCVTAGDHPRKVGVAHDLTVTGRGDEAS